MKRIIIKKLGGGGVLSTPANSFGELSVSKKMRNFSHLAFTLAEMMVVLLIMSIILAAMAPVMTTRDSSMRDNSSPWKWTDDRADTYFGLGDTQTAMIGQKEKKEIDGNKPP